MLLEPAWGVESVVTITEIKPSVELTFVRCETESVFVVVAVGSSVAPLRPLNAPWVEEESDVDDTESRAVSVDAVISVDVFGSVLESVTKELVLVLETDSVEGSAELMLQDDTLILVREYEMESTSDVLSVLIGADNVFSEEIVVEGKPVAVCSDDTMVVVFWYGGLGVDGKDSEDVVTSGLMDDAIVALADFFGVDNDAEDVVKAKESEDFEVEEDFENIGDTADDKDIAGTVEGVVAVLSDNASVSLAELSGGVNEVEEDGEFEKNEGSDEDEEVEEVEATGDFEAEDVEESKDFEVEKDEDVVKSEESE